MADRPGDPGPTEADVLAAIRDVQAAVSEARADVLRLRSERDEAVRRLSVYEQALRELTEPWEADCEDCADDDGFCDAHGAQFRNGLALARAALTTEAGNRLTPGSGSGSGLGHPADRQQAGAEAGDAA